MASNSHDSESIEPLLVADQRQQAVYIESPLEEVRRKYRTLKYFTYFLVFLYIVLIGVFIFDVKMYSPNRAPCPRMPKCNNATTHLSTQQVL